MNPGDKILDRIRKLLRLASHDGSSDELANEAAVALRKAQALMEKHGVDMAQVAVDKDGSKVSFDAADVEAGRLWDAVRLSRWDCALASIVSRAFQCQGLRKKAYDRQQPNRVREVIVVFGMPADVAVTKAVFPIMRKSMARAASLHLKEVQGRNGAAVKPSGVEIRSFKDGFVAGLLHSVREAEVQRAEVASESSGSELVVLANDVAIAKETAIEEYMKQLDIDEGRASSAVTRDHFSNVSGVKTGVQQDLSRRMVSQA